MTEDSFSDATLYLLPEDALHHARELRSAGADIVELGPAASNPDAASVSADQERQRIAPVLERLVSEGVTVSVDSTLPETQRYAMSHGAAMLNDIRGFPDASLYEKLAADECRLVVMHSIQQNAYATRVTTDPAAVWVGILRFFTERVAVLERAGVSVERIILDPGLGYFLGSNPEPSLNVLARIGELKERFGMSVLISPSRKSFLRAVTKRDIGQVGPASLAAELYAAAQGVDYIRTHDVSALRDSLNVIESISAATST